MSDGYLLAKLIRDSGKQPENEVVNLVVGEVTSIEPLKIKIGDRELPEEFFFLGALCQETHIKWSYLTVKPHKHSYFDSDTGQGSSGSSNRITEEANSEVEDILLWRGLEVGDVVFLLKLFRGQKYYIMQRQEGIVGATE